MTTETLGFECKLLLFLRHNLLTIFPSIILEDFTNLKSLCVILVFCLCLTESKTNAVNFISSLMTPFWRLNVNFRKFQDRVRKTVKKH